MGKNGLARRAVLSGGQEEPSAVLVDAHAARLLPAAMWFTLPDPGMDETYLTLRSASSLRSWKNWPACLMRAPSLVFSPRLKSTNHPTRSGQRQRPVVAE